MTRFKEQQSSDLTEQHLNITNITRSITFKIIHYLRFVMVKLYVTFYSLK